MEHEENITNFLKYGFDLGTKMASKLNLVRYPYWALCLERCSHAISKKIITDYIPNSVAQEKRFPVLKRKFKEIYDLFEDELSLPFISEETKKPNISWLKFEGDADLEAFDLEETDEIDNDNEQLRKTIVSDKHNRGICVTLLEKSNEKEVDMEIPISEMFQTAILLFNHSDRSIHWIYCVMYFLYGCIYHSVPNCSPQILTELDNFRKYANIKSNKIKEMIDSQKERIASSLEKNKYLIEKVSNEIQKEIENIDDEAIVTFKELTTNAINGGEMFADLLNQVNNFSDKKYTVDQMRESVEKMNSSSEEKKVESFQEMFSKLI